MRKISVGLFNDSFPPLIDGVSQTVKNYATHLHNMDCNVTVVTPNYENAADDYPFDVLRYPSFSAGEKVGYRVGVPFDPPTLVRLRAKKFDLMHVHAPFASSVLVNSVNHRPHVPVVLTYHTRFDLDIQKRIQNPAMRKVAMAFLLDNVNCADEVWVVTSASERFLRDIGYEGDCRVMENGTDFARGKSDPAAVKQLREQYHIPEDVPVLLFVGRMMWYKNTRLILDALRLLHTAGVPFRSFFIGEGYDAPAMQEYALSLGLTDCVIFTGAIANREELRTFYSLADLFLFPSTYDTCGIVVKEAAACDCPSVLLRDSCAAEGVVHGKNGYLAAEDPASFAATIHEALSDRAARLAAGADAGKTLYLSWEAAVSRARARYEEILDEYQNKFG